MTGDINESGAVASVPPNSSIAPPVGTSTIWGEGGRDDSRVLGGVSGPHRYSIRRSAGDPLLGRRSGVPGLFNAAALLAERMGVVGELVVERELFAGILSRVIDFGSPHGESAERLGL